MGGFQPDLDVPTEQPGCLDALGGGKSRARSEAVPIASASLTTSSRRWSKRESAMEKVNARSSANSARSAAWMVPTCCLTASLDAGSRRRPALKPSSLARARRASSASPSSGSDKLYTSPVDSVAPFPRDVDHHARHMPIFAVTALGTMGLLSMS
jgi:hypothetical protein